jgi:hypothetical protein
MASTASTTTRRALLGALGIMAARDFERNMEWRGAF